MLSVLIERLKRLMSQRVPMWQELLLLGILAMASFLLTRFPKESFSGTDGLVRIQLEQFIREVRAEMEQMEVNRMNEGRDAVFYASDFDLEVNFVLKQQQKGSAKLEYDVVTAEVSREIGHESTHKIVLHMKMQPPRREGNSSTNQVFPLDDAAILPPVGERPNGGR